MAARFALADIIAASTVATSSSRGAPMSTLPVTLFLTAAVGLGLYLLTLYLRGVRRPGLVAAHLLLGAGGLVQMMMLQKGTPSADVIDFGRFGSFAAGFFALSMISGLVTPLVARQG